MLQIAPSTYYDRLAKRADPARLSDRARRDAVLRPEVERVFEENWRVYGVRKVWRQLDREGFDVARCTVARLMKDMGIQGIIRGKLALGAESPVKRGGRNWLCQSKQTLWLALQSTTSQSALGTQSSLQAKED